MLGLTSRISRAPGLAGDRQGIIGAGAETEIPVRIHGRDGSYQCIDADMLHKRARHLAEMARHDLGGRQHLRHSPLVQGAIHRSMKITHGNDAVAQVEVEHAGTGNTRAKQVVKPDIVHRAGARMLGQCRKYGGRLAGSDRHGDLRTGRYQGNGLVGRAHAFTILRLIISGHRVPPLNATVSTIWRPAANSRPALLRGRHERLLQWNALT